MSEGFVGGCLCGAVRYDSQADRVVAGHCHCEDCRRSSGTGHGSNLLVPKDAVTIARDIKLYERKADSDNVVDRAFCPECGSHLYSLNPGMPEQSPAEIVDGMNN